MQKMSLICPILNHPLVDGVLVDDDAIVNFIQKKNLDFLPHELVCRSCKIEVVKLYNKKLKRAMEIRKLRKSASLHHNSISSVQSSRSSTTSEHSVTQNGFHSRSISVIPMNGNSRTNSMVENNNDRNSSNLNKTGNNIETVSETITPVQQSRSFSNKHSILQENQQNQHSPKKTIPGEIGKTTNVTIRKRTIKDFLTAKPKDVATNAPPASAADKTKIPAVAVNDVEGDDDVDRRLSQQPSTSKTTDTNTTKSTTANTNKRPISNVIDDSDDDDERLSLNAYNGTRLPNIQPIPPKRKQVADRVSSMARDIMDEYIKDITGG